MPDQQKLTVPRLCPENTTRPPPRVPFLGNPPAPDYNSRRRLHGLSSPDTILKSERRRRIVVARGRSRPRTTVIRYPHHGRGALPLLIELLDHLDQSCVRPGPHCECHHDPHFSTTQELIACDPEGFGAGQEPQSIKPKQIHAQRLNLQFCPAVHALRLPA